jgi:hypothetical protein
MHERIKFLSKLFKPPAQSIPHCPNIQTRFYYDVEDLDHFVILNHNGPVIRASDMERGYVCRDWLMKKFKHAIQYLRLTPRSCLVELLLSGKSNEQIEKKRVYVH